MHTNELSPHAPDMFAERHAARRAALACMVTLAVALGIGRFAFTPLLPLMLRGAASGQPHLDIQHGGWLASFNYAGYFVGAVACATLRVEPSRMVRAGLVATVLLTLAMGVASQFWVLALVRFIGGAVSAVTFVFASQWGLRRLAELGAHAWSGVIYTGPGVGIVGTGLLVSAAGGYSASAGWISFGVIAAILSIVVWPVFGDLTSAGRGRAQDCETGSNGGTQKYVDRRAVSEQSARGQSAPAWSAVSESARGQPVQSQLAQSHPARSNPAQSQPAQSLPAQSHAATTLSQPHRSDAFWLIVLYGVPGFGYIITATFLPVIAHHALPGSPWPDLFWPMFGAALVVGALLAARLPAHWDNRTLLAACYMLQAVGIAFGIIWPTAAGFSFGSILIGLPFTAITLFAMREARRLRGDDAAGLMGYATAAYGVGQIVGPLVAAPIAGHTGSFSLALWLAAFALVLGAVGLIAVAVLPHGRARPLKCSCS
jgi:MFS family permease